MLAPFFRQAWLLLATTTSIASAASYVVAPDGDDGNPGSEAAPFRSVGRGLQQLGDGDHLRLRGGTYRLVEEAPIGGLVANAITIEAYPGERPLILGSASTLGRSWEPRGDGVWRLSAEFLSQDPTGLFEASRRLPHATDLSQGRAHGGLELLTADDTWTKADAAGLGCSEVNAGCFIYLRSQDGDPNQRVFEIAQRGLARISGNDVTLRGLSILYTQPQPVFFEYADRVLLEHNVFGHVSNGSDNSYGVRIWESQGSVVRGNEVFDSEFWGGSANSKGITFMLSRPGTPNRVEGNYIHDIPGRSAVGTKGGVAQLIVRYNRIERVHLAFEVGEGRCVWSERNTDGCQPDDPEYHPAGNWRIYGNTVIEADIGLSLPGHIDDGDGNWLYNNVFHRVETGIELGWGGPSGNRFGNNLFLDNRTAIYLYSGETTTTLADYLGQFSSNHNLFFGSTLADIHLRPNWAGDYEHGHSYRLAEFQAEFARETASITAEPRLRRPPQDYRLGSDSPAIGRGDPQFWPGRVSVDIGAFAVAPSVFDDGFESSLR